MDTIDRLVSGDLEPVPQDDARATYAPKLTRDYECSNAKLSMTLGFIPRHSVLEAVTDLLDRVGGATPAELTDPRCYNIRWLELMNELKPSLERFATVL